MDDRDDQHGLSSEDAAESGALDDSEEDERESDRDEIDAEGAASIARDEP